MLPVEVIWQWLENFRLSQLGWKCYQHLAGRGQGHSYKFYNAQISPSHTLRAQNSSSAEVEKHCDMQPKLIVFFFFLHNFQDKGKIPIEYFSQLINWKWGSDQNMKSFSFIKQYLNFFFWCINLGIKPSLLILPFL